MKNSTKQTLKIYFTHAKRYRSFALAMITCVVAGSTVHTVIPLYYKRFFDAITGNGFSTAVQGQLIQTLLMIGLFLIIEWAVWRLAGVFATEFNASVMTDLANRCFAYLHRHSFTFFNTSFVGSLVKQINYFIRAFEGIVNRVIFDMLQLIINITLIFIILTRRDARLGIILILWAAIFIAANWFITKYKLKYDIAKSEAETKSTALLADTITNHSNLKLFNGYGRECKRYDDANGKVKKLRIFTWRLNVLFDTVQGFLAILLELGMFYFAIRQWQSGRFTIGDFALIQAYLSTIFARLWDFGRDVRAIYEGLADAEDMTRVLTAPHEILDTANAKELVVSEGKIEFIDVQFNYRETRTVLNNLTLTIAPHEKIAFVGPSGAGKSTIIKALLRMHDLTNGKIKIDGQRIVHVTQESLWQNISLVPQDPILFHRPLIENVRYGKPDATDAEVMEAAKLAHCHDFIMAFPEQYNTLVGERGIRLSGGERQRVAIARAILRNAPILVMDEATSSLDSESELFIQDALATLMQGKTVIVIAHRLSTIMKMDRIVVVNHGQIMEQGTHQQLLAKSGGLYKKLWHIQAGGFVSD